EGEIGQTVGLARHVDGGNFAAGEWREALGKLGRGPAGHAHWIALQAADPVYRRDPDGDARNGAGHDHGKPALGEAVHLGLDGHGERTRVMSNKMWGGRFASGPDAVMEEINASIDFDRRLYRQDIAASKAHAAMLAKQGIISKDDARKIAHGLDTILSEMDSGKFRFKRALEDIHMNVESRLGELIGPAAGRVHTARSRKAPVATDVKRWVRDAIDDIDAALAAYQRALADKALAHAAT